MLTIPSFTRLKKKMKENKWWDDFLPEFLIALLVLITFFVVIDCYQYLTTEYWWIQNDINYTNNTFFLIGLIIGLSFLPMKKWLIKWPKMKFFILGIFTISLFAHQKYSKFYDELQQYPKVKTISKDWGIPGSWVKITGRNFGGEWEPGKVYLGDTEMIIKKWGDKEVIFEIPVNVGRKKMDLKIKNNLELNQKDFLTLEIK